MIEARIGLQAALNGDRTRDEHAAVPVSVEELARDAAVSIIAGLPTQWAFAPPIRNVRSV